MRTTEVPAQRESSFLFVVCQVGAEPALKKELAREHPELKFAYSRPGFVTFKCDGSLLKPDFQLRSVFARSWSLSCLKLGPQEGTPQKKAEALCEWIRESQKTQPTSAVCLHIWERDQHRPGDEPLGFKAGAWQVGALKAIQKAIQKSAKAQGLPPLKVNQGATLGELVLDLVLVSEDEWWLGCHEQTPGRSPYPGGNPQIIQPANAPSRAYVKLEEALLWSGAPVRGGDTAVEVGSAPGGASFALLQRGVSVVGIDPAEMDPRVYQVKSARFRQVQKPVAAVMREDLPEIVDWLLLDMNVTPAVSLYAVDRLVTRMLKGSLLGLLLTVKLNQWKMADEIPSMIKHIRSMGMVQVKCTQLPGNRQEIFIFGLTRRGSLRASRFLQTSKGPVLRT